MLRKEIHFLNNLSETNLEEGYSKITPYKEERGGGMWYWEGLNFSICNIEGLCFDYNCLFFLTSSRRLQI